MDTGTHLTMGVALAGLSTLDSTIANDPLLFQAVMIGTVSGSVIPDLDTILKVKSNATYLKHHRGITHSFLAIFFWSILLASLLSFFFSNASFLRILLWTFLAVSLHIIVDLFNVYGTQVLFPYSKRWFALGFINTFDPFIFFLHLLGIIGWFLGMTPGNLWLGIYFLLTLYFLKRFLDREEIIQKAKKAFPTMDKIVTSPTLKRNYWRLAIRDQNRFYVAVMQKGDLIIVDKLKRKELPKTAIMNIAQKDPNISAFLEFSPIYYWEKKVYQNKTEIRFVDLRYRAKEHYPFFAIIHLQNEPIKVIDSYTGWIFSKDKLKQKLYI